MYGFPNPIFAISRSNFLLSQQKVLVLSVRTSLAIFLQSKGFGFIGVLSFNDLLTRLMTFSCQWEVLPQSRESSKMSEKQKVRA